MLQLHSHRPQILHRDLKVRCPVPDPRLGAVPHGAVRMQLYYVPNPAAGSLCTVGSMSCTPCVPAVICN